MSTEKKTKKSSPAPISKWRLLAQGPGWIICSMLDIVAHHNFGRVCSNWKAIQKHDASLPSCFLWESLPMLQITTLMCTEQAFFQLARKYSERAEQLQRPFTKVCLSHYGARRIQMEITVQFLSSHLQVLELVAPHSYDTPSRLSWYSFAGAAALRTIIIREGEDIRPGKSIVEAIIKFAPKLQDIQFHDCTFLCARTSLDCCHQADDECLLHGCPCYDYTDQDRPTRQELARLMRPCTVDHPCTDCSADLIEPFRCDLGLVDLLYRGFTTPIQSLTFVDCMSVTPTLLIASMKKTGLRAATVRLFTSAQLRLNHHPLLDLAGYVLPEDLIAAKTAFHIYVNQTTHRDNCHRKALEDDINRQVALFPPPKSNLTLHIHNRMSDYMKSRALPDNVIVHVP